MQLVAGNAQARGLVGRFRQQFLHVAQALFAQKLAVARRHEAAFPCTVSMNPSASRSEYARFVVMTLTRSPFASALMEGSFSPQASSPERICPLICCDICS